MKYSLMLSGQLKFTLFFDGSESSKHTISLGNNITPVLLPYLNQNEI